MPIKKFIYLLSAVLGGALTGFLLHALVELWYIPKLVGNFAAFGLGLTWQSWFKLHELLVISLTLGGAGWGFYLGRKWWQYIYVEGKYQGWRAYIKSARRGKITS